jgi:uncharacterized protein GlcG (DUF336 family)
VGALTIYSLAGSVQPGAQESLVTHKSLAPAIALDLAQAATPATASGKAWTAATFRSSTSNLFTISQPGMMQAGIRNLPGAVIIGGGLVVESGGSLVGAIGVSGAPGGDADEACAKAGIQAIQSKLDF